MVSFGRLWTVWRRIPWGYEADSTTGGYNMKIPAYLITLIDKASENAGSDYKLAKLLAVNRQNVSNWRHGHKACPVADQALMASIAGLDVNAWMARAVVNQYEGTAKGDALFKVLGKALLATGAAIGSGGASAHQIFSIAINSIANDVLCFIRCIKR